MPKTPRKKTTRSSRPASKAVAPKKPPGKESKPRPKPGSKSQRAAPRARPKKARPTISQVVAAALDDLKATDVSVLDVRHLTTVTDLMIVASGRSDRHVR